MRRALFVLAAMLLPAAAADLTAQINTGEIRGIVRAAPRQASPGPR